MTPQENLRRALLNDEFPGDAQEDRLFSPTGTDSLRQNRNIALSAWMTQVSGQDINAGSQTWQQDKDALVQGFFKNPTASNVSDDEIHGLVRSHIQTTEEAATMAAESALIGAPLTQMMGGFSLPNISTRQGVSGRMPIYKQDALKRYNALSIKLAPYRNLVNQVSGELRKEMESEVPTTDKLESMAERLLSVNPEDRPLVLKAIGATGGKDAKERASYLSKLAGAMGRMAETMGGSVESVAVRLGGTIQELADAPAAIAGLLSGGTSLQGEAATAKARSEESAAMRDKIDNLTLLTQQIRTIADQEINPIKGDAWYSQIGIDVARMIPQSAVTIANPALGMAANWAYFENTIAGEAMLQDPRLTPQQARSIAGISAPLNAAVETVTALIPFGRIKLPFIQKWLQATATSLPTTAARFGVRAAVGTAAEVGEEYLQARITLEFQELLGALQKDMPAVDWENRMPKFADIAAQTWGPALVFSLVGAGSVSISEVNSGRALASDVDLMVATGLAPAKAQSIAKAAQANNWQVVDAEFRDIVDKPAVATDTEKEEATQRYLAKIQAHQEVETINAKEAEKIGGVRIFRDDEGWNVELADGSIIKTDSADAARRYRDELYLTELDHEAESMIALSDDLVKAFPGTRLELREEVLEADSDGLTLRSLTTGKTTVIKDAKSLENLWREASAVGFQSGKRTAQAVLGDNFMEFGKSIARVFQRGRGSNDAPAAITAMHEVIEAAWRKGVMAGQWSVEGTRQIIATLVPTLEAGIANLGKETQSQELLWLENAKKAAADGDEDLIREVFVEMAVRTWIGRDRDGNKTGLRPGTILRALNAAVLQESDPENITMGQKVIEWFKSIGAYLKGVIATANIIRSAERDGTIDDFTGFLDKVLGIETATREENEVKDGVIDMAFSLAPELKNAQVGMSDAEITRYDETEKLRREAVKTAEAELAKLKEKRTTGVSWDEAYSDPEEGGVDPVPDGKTANHWTLLPPKDFQNLDRLYYDIDEYENGIVFGVNKSRKGNGDTWGEFPSLAEAKAAAEADFIQEAGEEWTGSFGANLDSQEVIKPIFNHFALPDGVEFEKDTAWGVTKWGSWYAHVRGYDQKRGEVRTLKLSVRDHEATRKDMGLPDLTAEVSKSWTPQEVADALKRIERKVWKRLSAIEERDVQNMAFSLAPELKDGSTFSLAPTEIIGQTGLSPAISVKGKPYTGRPGMTHAEILGDYVWRKIFTPQQRRDDPNQDNAIKYAHESWMNSPDSGFDDFGFLDALAGKVFDREASYKLLKDRGFATPDGSYSTRYESLDSSDLFNSKPVGSTFSLAPTERDSEHLAAVEAGDIAKAQRLVNKAARDAGTVWDVGDGQMYHGTRSEIEVMRTPAFFSPNPEMIYDQQQENKQHDYGDQIKPFFLFGKVKYGVEMPEYTWGVRSVEDDRITAAEDEGYDIVELVPYGDTSGGENSFFVAVNPSAIKSADPITYDNAGNVIPLSQRFNAASPDIRFSLSPQSGIDIVSDTLESWQDVFDKAAKRNPTRAMAIRDLAQQRINRLGEMWAADRWTAKGDKIRAVVEKRTKGSLDDEQAMREALLEGEKLAANMEASQAKAEAKAEAAAWRQEADDMQADDWSPRESLVRDMRVLNVALSAFPPEVRAKVTGGSMVKLAGLATERARYKAIQKALEKAIVETEVFMRKEYTEQVDNALDSYRSQKDSSGRISGKLPSQYTELVDYAYRIREASIEDQATESGGLEKALEESESDQQTQSVLTKMGILRLFEAWEMKDSTAMAAASEWLSETIENGKLGRKLLDEDRKAMLDDFRATAKKDAVPEGKISKVDVDNETNNVRFKVFRRAWQGLNGMLDSAVHTIGQRLELVFGENSKITDHFITSFIQAANASNDIKRDVNRKYHDMLSVVFNSRSRLAHARGIGQMQKVKASGIMITEGRVVEETKLDIETLTKLADGTMTAEAAGLRQDQVDAALEEWAASERKRTVTVETVKNAGEQKERQMTELQGLQWWLWSRQDASRKQMERDGWTEESFAQLDAFLSPEAKALGEWIAKGYDDAARLIDPVYRRLFRAPLPRVKNYAPIYRNRSGDASVMDLDASDISSGLSAGFTKSRVNTVSPLAEMDAVTVMLTHWENVAHWVTHAEAVRDAKAVLLDRDVMTAIKQSSGNVSENSIKQHLANIESQGTKAAKELHDLNRFWRWLMQYRAFKGLAFRISPVIKQTPALLNPLLADVPAHSYTVGLARAFYDPNAFNREVAEMFKSDTIMRRIEGGFSAEARITMQGEGAIGSVALALMQKGMMPMSWTDGGWTALGAAVSYDYYKRGYMSENPKASTAMADAYATSRLEKMIAVSAQPSDIVNRSLVEASPNNFMRSLWMFASDQRKALGIEVTALKKLLSGKSKNKAMDVQRILVAHFAQTAMSQLMASIMASFLGDDEDKEREWSREQWTLSLALGPINGLFVLGRMIDMTGRRILNMQAVQDAIGTGVKLPIFTNKTLFEQGVNDIWDGATSVDDLFNPEDPDDFIGAMESLAVGGSTAMSMAIGPQAGVVDVTANLVREGNKVIKAMSDEK